MSEEKEKEKFRISDEELKKIPKDKKCKVAFDVALELLLKECGGRDVYSRELAVLFGLDPEEINPVSEHCKRIFDKGLNPDTCTNFRFIRAWVMCKAWQLIDEHHLRFRDAIRAAWKIAKEICSEYGIEV